MRLCVPTHGDEGRRARVSGYFGRAPWLTVVDTESGVAIAVVHTPDSQGHCLPLDTLLASGIEAVACHHLGRRALECLQARGVRVLQTQALTVAGVIEGMRLVEPIPMNVASCSGHGGGCRQGHGHGHEHGHGEGECDHRGHGPHRHRRVRRSPR